LRKARAIILFSLFVLFITIFGCFKPRQELKFTERTTMMMDTFVRMVVYDQDKSSERIEEALDAALARMALIEQTCSRTIPTSEVSRINQMAGKAPVRISDHLKNILIVAKKFSELSQGAFDVTIYPILTLWDFTNLSSRETIPDSAAILKRLPLVRSDDILLQDSLAFLRQPGMGIDLGGIAKGYAVDQAYQILKQKGIEDFMVDAGGNLRLLTGEVSRGKRRIWIKNPRQRDFLWGYFKVDDQSVATSGDYERFFIVDSVRYHHILNPKTGYPAQGCMSVTVVAESAMEADALSTTIFVLGPKKGFQFAKSLPEIEVVILYGNPEKPEYLVSAGLKDKLVLESKPLVSVQ